MWDKIFDWIDDHGFLLFISIVMILFGVVIYTGIKDTPEESKQPCSYFKDYQMKDVPARCISYFQENK